VTLWALGLKIFQNVLNQGSFGNIGRTLRDVGKEKNSFLNNKNHQKRHHVC
jgi:hypothetical protein